MLSEVLLFPVLDNEFWVEYNWHPSLFTLTMAPGPKYGGDVSVENRPLPS